MAYKLGNYLQQLRGDLSFREVANRTHGKLSHNTISQAEKGINSRGQKYKPTPETLKTLAEVYNADYSVLMNLAGYLLPPEIKGVTASSDGASISVTNPNHEDKELNKIVDRERKKNDSQNVILADERIPVYGKIHAGEPTYASQRIIGYTPATSDIIDKYGQASLFALQIEGDSMSRSMPDGFTAVFSKDAPIENGDIVAVLIDHEDATIKRFKETSMAVIFEPNSYNPIYKPIVFQKSGEQDFKILGKYIYSTSMPI
ncbi:helix-turn-helix domain-containing protein [Secundilactobacillus muriivasis]